MNLLREYKAPKKMGMIDAELMESKVNRSRSIIGCMEADQIDFVILKPANKGFELARIRKLKISD